MHALIHMLPEIYPPELHVNSLPPGPLITDKSNEILMAGLARRSLLQGYTATHINLKLGVFVSHWQARREFGPILEYSNNNFHNIHCYFIKKFSKRIN